MRLSLALFILFVAGGTSFAQTVPSYDTNAYCKSASGDSTQLRKNCHDIEERAKTTVKHADVPSDIMQRCSKINGKNGNYAWLQACITAEETVKDAGSATPTRTDLAYDPWNEARKAQLRAQAGNRDAAAVDICPPPHKMTRDGCQ
jgi:hypothetical protein